MGNGPQKILEIHGLTARSGEEYLFSSLSFSLSSSGRIALTGPSGSGKTTLLRMIMGFDPIEEGGNVVVDGIPVNAHNASAVRSRLCWLPQNPFPGMGGVMERLLFPFYFKRNRDLLPDKTYILAEGERLGLAPSIFDRNTEELSGGERQRLAMILCRLLRRPLILLDEPTSALDRASRERAAEYLLSMEGAILSVSHDPEWIEKFDERVEL